MHFILDLTKERDARVDKRLRSDTTIWLTTVRRDGRPHTVPVWFLWDGASIKGMGQTPEGMAKSYSLPIRVTPAKFVSWGD